MYRIINSVNFSNNMYYFKFCKHYLMLKCMYILFNILQTILLSFIKFYLKNRAILSMDIFILYSSFLNYFNFLVIHRKMQNKQFINKFLCKLRFNFSIFLRHFDTFHWKIFWICMFYYSISITLICFWPWEYK